MKTLVIIIVLALLAWGGYALFNNSELEVAAPTTNEEQIGNNTTPPQNTATSTGSTGSQQAATSSPTVIPEVKEFTVEGRNFSFTPTTMRVNRGDRVKITFQSQGGTHDFVIDAFNARTSILDTGQTQTIEFVANQTGSFEYYCSVGTHRQMGMKGTLIVE